jgi:hypothetical protein
MTDWIDKFVDIEKELSAKRGPFSLFALILREDMVGLMGSSLSTAQWHVLVAAPWLRADSFRDLDDLVKKVQSRLSRDEVMRISRVEILPPADPFVKALNRAFNVEHSKTSARDSSVFDFDVHDAVIITSQSPSAALKAAR